MTEKKCPGRPRSDNKLTSAEKQAAYRLRCGARDADREAVSDFKISYEYQINYEIAQALKNYQLAVGDSDREANFHALNTLKRFKMIMDDKSNVIKTYKQDEIF